MRLARLLAAGAILATGTGCAQLGPYRTPQGIEIWQDPAPPRLSLSSKARAYQRRLESWHQMPDGLIRYRFDWTRQGPLDRGSHADGPFFLGIYLASQALRYAASGEEKAREQILLTLNGAEIYADVSGTRGLLARYYAPLPPPDDPRWRPSLTRPPYFWRSDVSKDQYAGFVHGLGVTLAVVEDAEIRARVAPLAAALADHLIEHELRIVDWDGEPTRYGSLQGRVLGVPLGVNALIALATAKTAAVATGEVRYADFYARLVEDGYTDLARYAFVPVPGKTSRVNEHMAHLALYPLLLLETDPRVVDPLARAGRKGWRRLRDDRNAFFAFVHAAVVGDAPGEPGPGLGASAKGREALREFPDRKRGYPVDLTRDGFEFSRALLKSSDGMPRSRKPLPLYLRPRGSSLWVSDPRQLAGKLASRGDVEYAGIDYLVAYWMGRYHGLLDAHE